MRRLLVSLAAGFSCGYVAARAVEAAAALRQPPRALPKDPARYGRTRRALMLAGIARSLATLAASAYVLAPRLERKRRARWYDPALVFATVTAVDTLVDLPVDYVEHYRAEHAFGVGADRPGQWLADHGKVLALTCVVGSPLVAGALALVRRWPRRWPWAVTLALIPFQILVQLVAPTFIAPLFNTFVPIEGPLEERLRALARRYGVGDAAILRVDMSRRTTKANAYVVGLFGTHRIVVGDTLLERFTPEEIEFVVAHELGHYVHRDTWKLVALGTAAGAVTLLLANAAVEGDAPPASTTWMLRLGFYASLFSTLARPLVAAFARGIEWDADTFAVSATGAPQSGVAAFSRLREQNLAEDEQPAWMELLFATHPSLKKRIAALESSAPPPATAAF